MKPGFLCKKGGRWRPVRMLDLVTLLHNVHAGARQEGVGFEDAQESLDTLTRKLSRFKVRIDPALLESVLWSCNLMDEKQLFWDSKERSFEEFVKQLLPGETFDKYFNLIKE